jgi:signal transduction histidine kinase
MKGRDEELRGLRELWADEMPFAVAAAHELKAPLALIRQLSLSLEQGQWNEAEQRRMLRHITLTSEGALRLTTDLTKATRLEDGLFELTPLNPRELCEEVAHELSPLFKAKNRELRVAAGRRPILAVGNRDLLRRIIMNFSDNALQYTDTATPVTLHASSINGGERIRISVRDFGPAVPADVWQTVKRYLGKAPQTLHNRPGSSGLGLYIAGQFADAMNGEIGATRHRDGATFYVELLSSRQLRLL